MTQVSLAARRSHYWIISLWIATLVWFVLAMLIASYFSELGYDDAYNASVAKNLALGLGWVSSYHEPVWFNPRVTTGPALILPLALISPFFDNPEWLPGIVATSLMLLALLACLHTLYQLVPREKFIGLGIVILFLLSLYDRNAWLVFIGDGLLALTLCWVLLRTGPAVVNGGTGKAAVLGMGIGFALLCKFYALIALAALPLTWLVFALQRTAPAEYSACKCAGWTALGCALLLLPWQLYQALALGQLEGQALAAREMASEQFFSGSSGLDPLLSAQNIPQHLLDNLSRNYAVLRNWLGNWAAIALLAGCFAATLAVFLQRGKSTLSWSLLALGLAICAHFGWFLLFRHGPWPHYLRVPVMLSLFFLPVFLAQYLRLRYISAAVFLFAVSIASPEQRGHWLDFALFQQAKKPTSLARQALLDHIVSADLQRPLAGCGWLTLRTLEYRLPGSGHLQDCMLLVQRQLEHDGYSNKDKVTTVVGLSKPVEFLIPVHEGRWNWAGAGHRTERDMLRFCPQRLYQNAHYTLLKCRVEALDPKTANYILSYSFKS